MLTYCVQIKYTKDALMAIIDEQQDRQAPAAALCESVGGKLVGMWGAMWANPIITCLQLSKCLPMLLTCLHI